MASVPNLKKEQSIIIDDEINSTNNLDKNNSSSNIIRTEVNTNNKKYPSSLGQEIESNLELNGEVKKNIREQRTAVCWNCESLLIVKNGWDIVECSKCHKLNRIPKNNSNTISVSKSYGNLSQDEPYIYGMVICPLCKTENKFRKNASNVTCYMCGNNINVSNNNLFNSYNQRNLDGNFINRSYDFSSPINYINNPYYPNVIQLRGLMPFPPMIPCYGNCTECTLAKILKALKKKPKETYIPYPMFPYRYEEPQKEIRYVPINTESKKVEPDDEYKIVIRKKPKNRISQSLGKYNPSKNKAFEKVFFSKLK